MKKFLTYLLLICAVIMNIYLIVYWNPKDTAYSQKNISKEVTTYRQSLYTVDRNTVLKELTDDNKKELKRIMYKLSSFDVGRLKQYMEDLDEDRGLINTFKLLKARLSSDDYKRMKEIFSYFVNMNELEKYLQ